MSEYSIRHARAELAASAARLGQLPADRGREIAFAGRSNAGKSSALNAILGRRKLARTSKTPGRTRLVHLFALDEGRRLADLPGYGYARVPEATRRQWERLVTAYLQRRRSLVGVVLIVDARRGLTTLDWRLLGLLAPARVPLHVLLTKADKLGRARGAEALELARASLEAAGIEASLQLFSAASGQGVSDARGLLDAWLDTDPRGEEDPGAD